jgi:hypothetical protein
MATLTQYELNAWIKGVNGFGLPFCKTIYTSTLGANTEATLTIPGSSAMGVANSTSKSQVLAVFSYEAAKKIYVAVNGTAAVPAGNSLVASTSELNPPAKVCKEGDVIHVISAATGDISIALYAIQVS